MDKPGKWRLSRRRVLQVSAAALVAAETLQISGAGLSSTASAQVVKTSIAGYILKRLTERKVKALFAVPGATCDRLLRAAVAQSFPIVATSSDLEAGQAADAYARIAGLGAVTVSYGVGTLALLPAIAGAYAERSPVVVLNGGPSAADLKILADDGTLPTHSIGRGLTDLRAFEQVTAKAIRIERARDAGKLIDDAISIAIKAQRPVYIEVDKSLWAAEITAPIAPLDVRVAPSGKEAELARAILAKLQGARAPVILVGIEAGRYGLADEATALIARLGLPYATTLLAKSVIAEDTPGFAGVYDGDKAAPITKQAIENADAILALGCVFGRQYRDVVSTRKGRMILAVNGQVKLAGKLTPAKLGTLISELTRQPWSRRILTRSTPGLAGLSFDERRGLTPAAGSSEQGLSYDDVMRAVSGMLDPSFLTITDTSLSMYPAADLNIAGRGGFMANAIWQSIGYSMGASVGAGIASERRPLVICGDGGFQITSGALSTLARQKIRAIVLVLDNGLYGIEQYLLESGYFASGTATPRSYLGLNRWDYEGLAKAMGLGFARTVVTGAELSNALTAAKAAAGPALISVRVKPHDLPSELRA